MTDLKEVVRVISSSIFKDRQVHDTRPRSFSPSSSHCTSLLSEFKLQTGSSKEWGLKPFQMHMSK